MSTDKWFIEKLLFAFSAVVIVFVLFDYGSKAVNQAIAVDSVKIELAAPVAVDRSPGTGSSRAEQVQRKLIEQYNVDPIKAQELTPIYIRAERESSVSTDILLAVSWAETRFRTHLVSHKGAVGIMQVMPNYWVEDIDFLHSRDDLFDATKNIRAAAQILSQCAQRFGMENIFRCYHGGPGGIYHPQETTLQYTDLVSQTLQRTRAGTI